MGNSLKGISHEDSVHIANYDENVLVNQGTPDSPAPQLTFHQVHGSNVHLLRGGRVAKRKESFCKGLAFSARPIRIDENVCIRFAEVVTNWSGVLRFGVTNVDPALFRDVDLPKFACPDLTTKDGYWAKALPERYCIEGAILHFYVNSDGDLYFGINGVLKGQFLNGINVGLPLWVIVDIYGNTSSLEFIDPVEVRQRYRIFGSRNRANKNQMAISNTCNTASVVPQQVTSNLATSGTSFSSSFPAPKYHSGVVFSPISFHTVRGKHVILTRNYTVAERFAHEFACGYVFTSRPLQSNEKIVIQVLDVEMAYSGALAFGLTSCDPKSIHGSTLPINSDDLLERPEYWVSIKDVAGRPRPTDELAFWITNKGEVFFVKNNSPPRIIVHVDTSVSLWAFFDVYGTTMRIRLLGTMLLPELSLPPLSILPRPDIFPIVVPPRKPRNGGAYEVDHDLSGQSGAESFLFSPLRRNVHERSLLAENVPPIARPVYASTSSEMDDSYSDEHVEQVQSRSDLNSLPNSLLSTSSLYALYGLLMTLYNSHLNGNYLFNNPVARFVVAIVPHLNRSLRFSIWSFRSTLRTKPSSSSMLAESSQQSSTKTIEDVDVNDECKICMNAKVNCVIYSCGHMSMCYECATATWHLKRHCPICRQKIEDVIKFYKA